MVTFLCHLAFYKSGFYKKVSRINLQLYKPRDKIRQAVSKCDACYKGYAVSFKIGSDTCLPRIYGMAQKEQNLQAHVLYKELIVLKE